MRSKILRIDSAGGGIFIYEALEAAARMIAPAKAGTRHIILFADAADSEEPGDYKTLVAKCVKAGITISVVGLGTEKDCDAELLKDIAQRGGGQCMFTNVAQELPRLFAQDTFVIARSAFLDEPVAVRARRADSWPITRQPLGDFPQIGGYNLCYLRPDRQSGDRLRRRVQGAGAGVVAGRPGAGSLLHRRGRRKIHRPDRRLEERGRFLHVAGPLDGRQRRKGLGKDVVATQELRNGVCRDRTAPRSRSRDDAVFDACRS